MFLAHLTKKTNSNAQAATQPAPVVAPAPVVIVVNNPEPGEFRSTENGETLRHVYRFQNEGANRFGACDCCKQSPGSAYVLHGVYQWEDSTDHPDHYNAQGPQSFWRGRSSSFICWQCAAKRQATQSKAIDDSPPVDFLPVKPTDFPDFAAYKQWKDAKTAAELAPETLPNFGDTVQTPDGRTGTMRGSGGIGSDRVQVENSAGNRSWHNRSELRRVKPVPALAPDDSPATVQDSPTIPPTIPQDAQMDNISADDWLQKETDVVAFGNALKADRIAKHGDIVAEIRPNPSGGFLIVWTNGTAEPVEITCGIYGFAFSSFDRTVDYAAQKFREFWIAAPEDADNGCQIERRYHNRRECFVYVVTLPESLSSARFKTIEGKANRLGGWYAREYRPGFQRGGFMFESGKSARRFAAEFTPATRPQKTGETSTGSARNCSDDPAEKAPGSPAPNPLADFSEIHAEVYDALMIQDAMTIDGHVYTLTQLASPPAPKQCWRIMEVNPAGHVVKIDEPTTRIHAITGIAERVRVNRQAPAFRSAELERRDAERRVIKLKSNGWTVDGAFGTTGPPSVFSTKQEATEYAIANRRAIVHRLSGFLGGCYQPLWPDHAPKRIDNELAARLESLADAMTDTIRQKLAPCSQNYTPKRGRETAVRNHEGANLKRCQEALRVLAAGWRSGTVPQDLQTLRTKTAILGIVSTRGDSAGYYVYRETEQFRDNSPIGVALREYVDSQRDASTAAELEQQKRRREIQQAEESLRGRNVPGFFPTPPALVDRMIDAANLPAEPSEDFSVLEPSAGIGSIADKVAELIPKEQVNCVEVSQQCYTVLTMKGFTTLNEDFLTLTPCENSDVVLMNPPFENLQDIDHVRHAFQFLKPGGRLVAIMSEGAFNTSGRRKCQEFAHWFNDLGGESEPVAGAFNDASAFRSTGVSVRLVTICKD